MMDNQIRKYERILKSSGKALVLFGIWSILKNVLTFVTGQQTLTPEMSNQFAGKDRAAFLVLVVFLLLISVVVSIGLSLYIARSAYKEANGKKAGNLYLVICVLGICTGICGDIYYFLSPDAYGFDEAFTYFLMDLANGYAYVRVIHSALKLRKMRKRG